MGRLNAEQRRYIDNSVFIAASQLLFGKLTEAGIPILRLEEVAETSSGGTPSRAIGDYFGGDIPWIKSGDLTDGPITTVDEYITEEGLRNSSARIFPSGTVVIALYGATVGKTGLLTFAAASNQAVCAVIPKSDAVSKEYLYWFLRYKRQDFINASFGGAQPNISQRLLRDTSIPIPDIHLQESISQFFATVTELKLNKQIRLPNLPSPLNDVTRIVAHIDALAEQIAVARGLRQGAVEEAEAFMQNIGVTLFGTIPQNDWMTLSHYVSKIENGWSPEAEKRPASPDEWGVLKVGSVTYGFFNPTENKALPPGLTPKKEYEVKAGDLLMSRANTREWVGAVALVFETRPRLMLSDKIFRFQLYSDVAVEKQYLWYLLKSPALRSQIEAAASGTSPTMKNISKEKVLSLLIPPHSPKEQIVILNHIASLQAEVERLKHLQAETAAELDALLPSLLDRAFRGAL